VVLDYYCGTADDGCGNTLNCGVCSSGQTCSSGACVSNSICIPKTCGQLGYDCSTGTDGCGNALNCGTCSNNQTCDNGICKTNGGGGGSGGTTPPPDQPIITKPVKQMTRAQILAAISQIQALIADLQKQLVALTGTATTNYSCTQITKNLFYGMANNPQVKCLQEVLKSQGYAVSGSGNYDAATKTAVVQFQQKYASEILAPYHLTRGSGNIGNATLAKLNAIISINSK